MSLVLKNNLGETHNGNLFQENMLTKKVIINITKLRQNIKILLEQYLNTLEALCLAMMWFHKMKNFLKYSFYEIVLNFLFSQYLLYDHPN